MPNHLGTRAVKFHFSGTETCLSLQTNVCFHTNSAASSPKGPPCLKGHCIWEVDTNPTPNPNTAPLPSPVVWGKERQDTHPTQARVIGEGGPQKPALCTEEPPSREVQTGTGGNHSRKEETKRLHLIFILFSPLSLLSPLLCTAENKGN